MKKLLSILTIVSLVLWSTSSFAQPIGGDGPQGGTGGVRTASSCDAAAYYPLGTLCQDTDDNKLYLGTGAAVVEIGKGDTDSVGDCTSGACLDGSSDGGTYIRLYDGTSAYISQTAGVRTLTIVPSNTNAESLVITFGNNDNTVALGSGTGASVSINGNAGTATALAANGANCTAGNYPLGVDASGAVESCTALTTVATDTIFDAAGDIVQGTGSNTAARLPIGTAGQMLKVNSGATALEYTSTISIGTLDMSGGTSSIPMVVGTGTASGITEAGRMYFESDTEILTIGDGATSINLDLAPNVTYTFPTATSTLARTDAGQTFTGVNVFTAPTFTTSIAPTVAGGTTIGTTSAEFGNVYLTDSAVIYGQADQSNSITSAATGWTFAKPITVSDVTNDNYIKITNNASRAATASVNELYPEANIWKANQNGTESSIAIGPTAGQVSFTGPTAARAFALPDAAATIQVASACTALASDGAATALTVTTYTNCFTLTVDDNEDQTITFSGAGYAGQEITIIFTTAGSADEVITFHATLVSSTGTLTLGTDAGKYYTIRFISNGTHWFEVSRTAVQT